VSTIERLVDLLAAQYRWGLHPLKVSIALALPVVIVWLADRWLRARTPLTEDEESRTGPLPRVPRP